MPLIVAELYRCTWVDANLPTSKSDCRLTFAFFVSQHSLTKPSPGSTNVVASCLLPSVPINVYIVIWCFSQNGSTVPFAKPCARHELKNCAVALPSDVRLSRIRWRTLPRGPAHHTRLSKKLVLAQCVAIWSDLSKSQIEHPFPFESSLSCSIASQSKPVATSTSKKCFHCLVKVAILLPTPAVSLRSSLESIMILRRTNSCSANHRLKPDRGTRARRRVRTTPGWHNHRQHS